MTELQEKYLNALEENATLAQKIADAKLKRWALESALIMALEGQGEENGQSTQA